MKEYQPPWKKQIKSKIEPIGVHLPDPTKPKYTIMTNPPIDIYENGREIRRPYKKPEIKLL